MSLNEEINITGPNPGPAEVKVWDIAVRLFHWSLVAMYTLAWLSADEWDWFHEVAGYTVGGLLGFRIFWGLVGTNYARFSNFIYKPSTVLHYLRATLTGRAKRFLGHNPAGGAMVIALLLSLIAVTATGIAVTSDMFRGSDWMGEIHEAAASATLALIALHIAGVLFASIEFRENLVKAMITGLKRRT